MPDDFSTRFNGDKKIKTAMQRMPQVFLYEFRETLNQIGENFIADLSAKRFRGRPALKRPTGDLARSFTRVVNGTSLNNLSLRISSGSKYAATQEFGATIVAKKKFLTVPIGESLTPGGAFRGMPLKDIPNEEKELRKTKRGWLVLRKRGKSLSPIFALVKSVVIPPRLGFIALWDSPANRARIQRKLGETLSRATRKALANG